MGTNRHGRVLANKGSESRVKIQRKRAEGGAAAF